MVVIKFDDAAVGDSDAMGVSAEIGEHLVRTAKGGFALTTHSMLRAHARWRLNTAASLRWARSLKKCSSP